MIVALDVAYNEHVDPGGVSREHGLSALVAFESWQASAAEHELTVKVPDVRPYVAGRFVERELPCLLAGLEALAVARPDLEVELVVIDGNVRLDQQGRAGLGMHLYQALDPTIPVVGVAKNSFAGLVAIEVTRGDSSTPLYLTAAGIDEQEAATHVQSMHGDFRMPTLLRRADQLTRG